MWGWSDTGGGYWKVNPDVSAASPLKKPASAAEVRGWPARVQPEKRTASIRGVWPVS